VGQTHLITYNASLAYAFKMITYHMGINVCGSMGGVKVRQL